MPHRTLALLLLLPLTLPLSAEVPYTFASGQKAKAQEVNENFRSLDARTASLEHLTGPSGSSGKTLDQRVADLETLNANQQDWMAPNPLTYVKKAATPGRELTINGKKFKIVRLPFIEFKTGDHYAVSFPQSMDSTPVRFQLSAVHQRYLNPTNTSLDGYPGSLSFYESLVYGKDNKYVDATNSYQEFFLASYYASASFEVILGETRIYLEFRETKPLQQTAIATDATDMLPNADWTLYQRDSQVVAELDDLIDYIQIEKLP